MGSTTSAPDTPEVVWLDIVRGPERHFFLSSLGPNRLKNRLLAFRVQVDDTPMRLCLQVDGFHYDRFDANAIIATANLISSDLRAKDFCSQVQFHYDCCTCDTGKMRLIRQSTAVA